MEIGIALGVICIVGVVVNTVLFVVLYKKIKVIKKEILYIIREMSGASAVTNKFDAAYMAQTLKEWQAELQDEVDLEARLQTDAGVLLQAARVHLVETADFVREQLDSRVELLENLRTKIEENKDREKEMTDYANFVNSTEYLEHCERIRQIEALDHEIHNLLLLEERLGRPPVTLAQQDDEDDASLEAGLQALEQQQ
jgi:hypothetical protein